MKKIFTIALAMILCALVTPALAQESGRHGWFLGRVEIEGNQHLRANQIQEVMENQPPALLSLQSAPRFDRTSVERDQERIRQLYQEEGFFQAKVAIVLSERAEARLADLKVTVEEGQRFHFGKTELVFVDEKDEVWRESLLSAMGITEGQPVTMDAYGRAKENARAFLANHARPLCQIKGQLLLYTDTMEAIPRLLVQAGPSVKFGRAELMGQGQVDRQFIERRIGFLEGQPFSEEALKQTQQSIFAGNLFSNVTLTPLFEQMQEDQVPIAIDWQEAPPHALSLGLGWGTEDQFRLQIYQVNRNLFKLNDTLTFEGKYSSIYTGLTGRWQVPFGRSFFELQGGARQTDNEAYNDKSLFINPSFSFELYDKWNLSIGFLASLYSMRELKASVPDPGYYDSDTLVSGFPLALSYDSRDSILNPTRGTLVSLSLQLTSQAFGSDVSFIEPKAGISQIIPLSLKNWAFAWRANGGLILPTEDKERIPLYCRYFPGGSMSVRGYRYQNLGPMDENSRPLGGEAYVEGSLELRFPLIGDLGGVLFVDLGNAYESYHDLSGGLRYTCGAGLRYNTPLGPVRLDFGYILNAPENYDYADYQVYLSVGQAF